jgi:sugar phosphate isomerase/epimerase
VEDQNQWTRRKWIGATSGGLAAAIVSASRADDGNNKHRGWKLAIGLNGFKSSSNKYQQTFPIWEVLDYAERAGFDGVELVQGWPQGNYPRAAEVTRVQALRRMYDQYGLQIFSIQTAAAAAFDPSQRVRDEWIAEMRGRIEFAKAIGCDCVGTWPFGPLRGQTIDQAIRNLAASFREVAKIADDQGIIFAFEIEPPFQFNTEGHLQRILDIADQPRLKTIYDSSHFDLMNGSVGKPHEMLNRIGVQHIGYVHFTDCDGTLRDGGTSKHLAAGDGQIDIEASLNTLHEGGFRGWIMIDAWQIPDPYDACTKGIRAIRQF